MPKRKFLIDTDAAADDMLALLMAMDAEEVSIEAITVVSGAVRSDQGVQNVLRLLKTATRHVPVYAGRATPLLGPLRDSTHVMGVDGLGGTGPKVGEFDYSVKPAADAVREFIRGFPNDHTIVCLGPLTNLALALLIEPTLVEQIGRLVIMGGVSDGIGNITPAAEYNIWTDPEAAKIVFESGIQFELVGWDVSRQPECRFQPFDLDQISVVEGQLATQAIDALTGLRNFLAENLGTDEVDLPDPIAMAIAIDDTVATGWVHQHVEIDTSHGPSRGATIVDHLHSGGGTPNAQIAVGACKDRVFEMLKSAVREPSNRSK